MFSMPSCMTSQRRGDCSCSFSLLDPKENSKAVLAGQSVAVDDCDEAATSSGDGPDAS